MAKPSATKADRWPQRRISHSLPSRRTIGNERRSWPGRGRRSDLGGQDKSHGTGASQALDRAWFSPCRTVGARAARRGFSSNFNALYGTIGFSGQHPLDLSIVLTYIFPTMENSMASKTSARGERIVRGHRLEFRLDETTRGLIERAAQLERRTVSDYCFTAIVEAVRRTIAKHEALNLSERDRAAFFEAMINPPEANKGLACALAEHGRRVGV